MSEYPATLEDLATVETNLQRQITKLKDLFDGDSAVTDEKVAALREALVKVEDAAEDLMRRVLNQQAQVLTLHKEVARLKEIWTIAKRNPELIRELAVNVLGQDE